MVARARLAGTLDPTRVEHAGYSSQTTSVEVVPPGSQQAEVEVGHVTVSADVGAALAAAAEAAASALQASLQAAAALASANAALASQNAAGASQTAANTSATNAAGSASTATTQANFAFDYATEADLAANDAFSYRNVAAAHASNAAASATSASGYATAAGNSATAANTSKVNAATSESNAATSANNALTSKNAAATSAANALTSEGNASASAANALSTYTTFDKRYLGAKATPPANDNQGAALLVGAEYWDTALGARYVWNGAAWVIPAAAPVPDDAIDNFKLANMATATIKGRNTAGTGDPQDLTAAQVRTLLALGSLALLSSVTDTELRAGAAASVIGRSAATSGAVADIASSADGQVLRRSGTTLAWGTLDGSLGITAASIPDAKLVNRAAASIMGRSAATTGVVADIASSADGQVLRRSGTTLAWGQVATLGLTDSSVTDIKLASRAAASIMGRSAATSGVAADIASSADGQVLRRAAGVLGWGAIDTAGLNDNSVTLAKLEDLANGTILGRATAGAGDAEELTTAQVRALLNLNSHGQCRFVYISTTQCRLQPLGGDKIIINGVVETIPAAGVNISNAGLVAGAFAYVYAYMNAGVMTLELSTTGHGTNAGVETKSTDVSRTLVGMVCGDTGAVFSDTLVKRYVISWFNRRTLYCVGTRNTFAVTTANTWLELSTTLRSFFISWGGGENVLVFMDGHGSSAIAGQGIYAGFALNGGLGSYCYRVTASASWPGNMSVSTPFTIGEGGPHTCSPYVNAAISAGSSASFELRQWVVFQG